MKKYVLPFCLLLAFTFNRANAQQFLSDSTYVTDTTTNSFSDNEADAFIYFHNTTANPVKLQWNMVFDTIPTAWGLGGICDNNQCYTGYLTSPKISDTIYAGDTMVFKTEFNPNCLSGLGKVKVSAHVFGSFSPYDTITFVANITTECSSAGVLDLSKGIKSLQLFPNPTTGNLTVQGLPLNGHSLTVDVLGLEGQVLLSYRKTNNSLPTLDCNSLPAGMYLLRITDTQDGSLSIGKFCKL